MVPIAILVLAAHYCLATNVNEGNAFDYCMDGMYHKEKPGPEAELYKTCTPWKKKSCCTHNTTVSVHEMNMYNFNYDHCAQIKTMSEKCKQHFIRDACFFECEPNLGLWVVPVNMKTRNETVYKVPLCRQDCDDWYRDCKDDYTCAKNWIGGFQWNGTNYCKPGVECITFEQMYADPKDFCESVWNNSWEYVSEDKPCMNMWFAENEEEGQNPNEAVVHNKLDEIRNKPVPVPVPENDSAHVQKSHLISMFIVVAIFFLK